MPPVETLDGFGRLQRAAADGAPIAGKEIAGAIASPRHPPGFYGTADARRALNLVGRDRRAEADRGPAADVAAARLSAAAARSICGRRC